MNIFPVFIPHAGCRQSCVYCDQRQISRQHDVPSPAAVARSVRRALRKRARFDEVAFFGGSFTALDIARQEAYLDALSPCLQDGSVGGIRLSTRPDALDEMTVERMVRAGVRTVELGCQTFSDVVLQAAGRGHAAADSNRAVRLLRAGRLRVGLQLMPGLPAASAGEGLASARTALELAPDFLRVYPTVVLAGTELERMWRRGAYRPLPLEEAVDLCADIEAACRRAAVPVVRCGLLANDLLQSGVVLAGPYHPAFGQMVRSRLWLRALDRLRARDVRTVFVHPHDLSDAVGHGRSNLARLRHDGGAFAIRPAPHVRRGSLEAGGRLYVCSDMILAKEDRP